MKKIKQLLTVRAFSPRRGWEVCKDLLFFIPEIDERVQDQNIYDSLKRPLKGEDPPFRFNNTDYSDYFTPRFLLDGSFLNIEFDVEASEDEENELILKPGSLYTYTGGFLEIKEEIPFSCVPNNIWFYDNILEGVYFLALFAGERIHTYYLGRDYPLQLGLINVNNYRGSSEFGEDYHPISTAEDLLRINDYPTENYYLTTDISLDGYIDGDGWLGISNFSGIFDGNGYTILNLYRSTPTIHKNGLFRNITGATIRNVVLKNVYVAGLAYNGALVGSVDSGINTIENCYVDGGEIIGLSHYAGGLIGYVWGGSTLNVNHCSTNCTSSTITNHAGGLIGGTSSPTTTINNCFSSGSVSSLIDSAGGFIGFASQNSTISYCYSICRTTGVGVNTGGFIGQNQGSGAVCNSCYWDIDSSGQAHSPGENPGEIEGKTTEEMVQQATFVGWDFVLQSYDYGDYDLYGGSSFIWDIREGHEYPYFNRLRYDFPLRTIIILAVVYLNAEGHIIEIGDSYRGIYDRYEFTFPGVSNLINGGVLRDNGWFNFW